MSENPDSTRAPLCVGQLGWDITSIGHNKVRSYGGAVLHYVSAAAVVGVRFSLLSYVNINIWRHILIELSKEGINSSRVIDFPNDVAFNLVYDEGFRFVSDEFAIHIAPDEPDISSSFEEAIVAGQFVHICPATPKQDCRNIMRALDLGARVSMQLTLNNIPGDVGFYRRIINEVDYAFMNEKEAMLLTSETNLDSAIKALSCRKRKSSLYITSHERVVAITPDEIMTCPALMGIKVVDPTGAGDAFAGGCTAGRMLTGRHDIGLRFGTLCAMAKLTGFSSNALLSLLGVQLPAWEPVNDR